MATTYAAYANVMAGQKAQSQLDSARTSVSSTSSAKPTQKKSKFQRFLDEFKPVEVAQEPIGFFADLRPKKASTTPKQSKGQQATRAYEGFKTLVGGEKVYFNM